MLATGVSAPGLLLMLVIRLQRTGSENTPTYRLVVAEKKYSAKGKWLELVGHYLPNREPAVLEYKADRIQHWIKQGAQPSDTVARLLRVRGISGLDQFVKRYVHRKPTKTPEEPAAPVEPTKAAAAPAEPTPPPAEVVATPEDKPAETAPAEEGGDKPETAA